jgi:hypothetical protein
MTDHHSSPVTSAPDPVYLIAIEAMGVGAPGTSIPIREAVARNIAARVRGMRSVSAQLPASPVTAEPRLDFGAQFEWAHGPRWQQADLIRQGGTVFRWDEDDIRYKPTTESGKGIEWQKP